MTNTQLYLSLGIPALLILANMGVMFFLFQSLNGRIDRLDSKVDTTRLELTARINSLDGKVDTTRLELTARINSLDGKIDSTRLELTARIDRVADATMTFYRELDKHDSAIAKHDAAIDKLQGK